jgi:hypothetical protein
VTAPPVDLVAGTANAVELVTLAWEGIPADDLQLPGFCSLLVPLYHVERLFGELADAIANRERACGVAEAELADANIRSLTFRLVFGVPACEVCCSRLDVPFPAVAVDGQCRWPSHRQNALTVVAS